MSTVQSLCTSFKTEILDGIHAFGTSVVRATTTPDVFKIALYTSSATIGPDTTVYTTSDEVFGTGYTAGGQTLTVNPVPAASGTTALLSFDNVSWTNVSFTARAALIYNSTQGGKAVCVLDFGSDKTGGPNFTIEFPTADAANAIIRIS